MKIETRSVRQEIFVENNRGSALIAALLLVAVSGIMGATILFATSTDLQISGNYRRAIQTFYAAEAGLAETQRRLHGSFLTDPAFLGDEASPYQLNWSAYVISQTGWDFTEDHAYNSHLTNYVPVPGNATNTFVRTNSVQSGLSYWTKVHHKTEYDAEQDGHRQATPHYVDGDGTAARHSRSNRGQLIRFGYPLSTSVKPEQFTTSHPPMYPPVETITSHGQVEGADSILRVDVTHPAGPPVWAPMYVGSEVVLSGSMITVQGMDTCALIPSGRPPISLAPSASVIGTAGLMGQPATPQASPVVLNLDQQINDLKKNSTPLLNNVFQETLGSVSSPTVYYAEPSGGTLAISEVTGFGILLVKGDLQIAAPFQWNGLVVVSGGLVGLDRP